MYAFHCDAISPRASSVRSPQMSPTSILSSNCSCVKQTWHHLSQACIEYNQQAALHPRILLLRKLELALQPPETLLLPSPPLPSFVAVARATVGQHLTGRGGGVAGATPLVDTCPSPEKAARIRPVREKCRGSPYTDANQHLPRARADVLRRTIPTPLGRGKATAHRDAPAHPLHTGRRGSRLLHSGSCGFLPRATKPVLQPRAATPAAAAGLSFPAEEANSTLPSGPRRSEFGIVLSHPRKEPGQRLGNPRWAERTGGRRAGSDPPHQQRVRSCPLRPALE
ncbi:hypothetical protein CALVIDRAFT_374088 [Calocera viscosa TUFC12733]|uniref:Uncharacterized protein n=1 Tax=Calocera viscosa (strain TUFC12733) TaxID=1330018 RepID=A0A167GS21_CALVF|nr:hypothetical protein CALVIDRAFT_374088 [Calocera viscosa TUFC12733]